MDNFEDTKQELLDAFIFYSESMKGEKKFLHNKLIPSSSDDPIIMDEKCESIIFNKMLRDYVGKLYPEVGQKFLREIWFPATGYKGVFNE